MKKMIPFLLALTTLCGCWDYTEIKDQTIMAGISVDKVSDGVLSVGFEILPMTGSEQDKIEPYVLSCEGQTVEEALYNMAAKVSHLPYVSHAWLMLVSEDVAKDGIGDILDLIATHPDFYLATNIAVVKGDKAIEAYNCETVTSPIIAHEISNGFVTDERFVGKTTPLFAYEAIVLARETHMSYTLPAISLVEDGEGKVASNDGAAVFNGNTLVDFIDADESQMLNIALNKIDEGIVALPVEDKLIDFKFREISASYEVTWNDEGIPDFNLKVELAASTKVMPGQFDFALLEQISEQYFTEGLYKLIDKVKDMKSDFMQYSLVLHRQHLTRWREIADRWEELLPDINCSVELNVTVLD